MKLYARRQGQGSELVSIHGLFGSQENLGAINRNLSDQFRVHGLDVRNHGRSPHSDTMDYTAMAEDILEYLDDQALKQVDLLGHSMGGKIAMTVALLAPDRIRKLVVMDIAPVEYAPRHDDVLAGLAAINLKEINRRSDAEQTLQPFIKEKDIRQFLLKNLYRDESGHFQWRINLDSIQTNYPEIMKGQSAKTGFSGETLFLKGADSDYILPEHREQVLALFPKASVKVVAETGHWLHAQKPELVSRSISRFLMN
ncbi:alpha/beta fold hydrolase [Endozoicomonas sp. Mp262]|uniref:alpha/beta fold hydrolase n=1 Tax=Endozoicomonas sp. Mp262 TaxID=2919499 RepID=UPI0021D904B9